ncbi:MAG: hypothetical protein DRI87_01935 [Bacteroidetes bacterium]|nr:MAG: hypothetical protein DRI87_01935 [Bacteroidota bacterium]
MTTKIFHHLLYISLIYVTAVFLPSCSENREASDVFSAEELVTINKLIGYFDSIVGETYPEVTNIDSAYRLYLDSVCPLMLKNGDMSRSGIDAHERKTLLDRFDRKAMSEIFIIGDTLEYFSLSVKKKVKKYYPYYVTLNPRGSYMELLDRLSENSDFIRSYNNEVREFGDLTPKCYGMMLRDYNELDFTDPMQRLMFVVNVLHTNEVIKDRFRR